MEIMSIILHHLLKRFISEKRQKWLLLSGFPRICAGSHKLDLPCSGFQAPAVLVLSAQRRSCLMSCLSYKSDSELYGAKLLETLSRFPRIVRTCIVSMHHNAFQSFLRLCAQILSTGSGTTESQKVPLYTISLGTFSRLWIPLADQMIDIKYFLVSISCLLVCAAPSHDRLQIAGYKYLK
jgi:hypothetical protein